MYVKYVMTGINYLNKNSVRPAKCKGHALDAARLFTLGGYPSPVDLSDSRCWTRIIVHSLEREEDIAKQRPAWLCEVKESFLDTVQLLIAEWYKMIIPSMGVKSFDRGVASTTEMQRSQV